MKLTHFRLCPHSRSIRLALAELGAAPDLVELRPSERTTSFLELNPAGELPVLTLDDGLVLAGTYPISEYLAETATHWGSERRISLFPGSTEERAEIRRLVGWFHTKCDAEVTSELATQRLAQIMEPDRPPPPRPDILRAARANLRYHLSYLDFLAHQRHWLAGDELSFADLAAASHMSVLDYLGEIAWDQHAWAKGWYERIKSRKSFRPLLADRVPGLPPPLHYTELDF